MGHPKPYYRILLIIASPLIIAAINSTYGFLKSRGYFYQAVPMPEGILSIRSIRSEGIHIFFSYDDKLPVGQIILKTILIH